MPDVRVQEPVEDGMSASYNRKAQVARQRAYRRLAEAYTDEFERLHDDERARVGLAPPDPAKWQTRQLRQLEGTP